MPVVVRIPTVLRPTTGNKDEISVPPGTVGAVLDALGREYPDFKNRILVAFNDGMKHRPQTTYGTMNADVLLHFDPDFKPGNMVNAELHIRVESASNRRGWGNDGFNPLC